MQSFASLFKFVVLCCSKKIAWAYLFALVHVLVA